MDWLTDLLSELLYRLFGSGKPRVDPPLPPEPEPQPEPEPIPEPEPAPDPDDGPESGAYFAMCVRWDYEGREEVLKAAPWVRIAPWEQRRSPRDTMETLCTRAVSMAEICRRRGYRIWLGCDWLEPDQPGYEDPGHVPGETATHRRQRWGRQWFTAMAPYEDLIDLIGVVDEPPSAATLRAVLAEADSVRRSLGVFLSKPFSTTVCGDMAKLNLGRQNLVDVVAIEGYAPDSKAIDAMGDEEARAIIWDGLVRDAAFVRSKGKRVALITQAYCRNYDATNARVLAIMLRTACQWAEAEIAAGREVVFEMHFSAMRGSGFLDPKVPWMRTKVWPQGEAGSRRLRGEDVPYPTLPPDPRPGPPESVRIKLSMSGFPGPSAGVRKPRQGGTIVAKFDLRDANGRSIDSGDADDYRTRWTLSDGVRSSTRGPGKKNIVNDAPWWLTDGKAQDEYRGSLGRRVNGRFRGTARGTVLTLSVRVEIGSQVFTASRTLPPVQPCGELTWGPCTQCGKGNQYPIVVEENPPGSGEFESWCKDCLA